MSKIYTQSLFNLIHAMTGSEKRYFKRYLLMHGGKETHTGKLFDAYCRQKEFDETKLARSEKYLTGFAQHKQHLTSMVLRSLRSYHSNSDREMQVTGLLNDVGILRRMRQYELALSTLNKAMRIAVQSENVLQQLDILKKRDEIRFDARAYVPPENIARIREQELHLLERYNELITQRAYTREMYNLHKAGEAGRRQTTLPAKRPAGFHALRYFLTSQTALAHAQKNLRRALAWSAEHVRLVESKPDFISDFPHEYMKVLSSRMVIEDMLGRYNECLKTIAALRELQRNSRYSRKMKKFESHTFVYTYTGEINALVRTSRFDQAVSLIPAILRGLEKFSNSITPAEAKVFHLNISLIYLYTANAKRAYRFCAKALNEMFDERQDLNFALVIVRLLALHDRGDYLFLLRQIKKDSNFLMESGIAKKLLPEFLNLLRNISLESVSRNRKKLLVDFLALTNTASMRSDSAELSRYFEFQAWINSKILNSTVASILISAKR